MADSRLNDYPLPFGQETETLKRDVQYALTHGLTDLDPAHEKRLDEERQARAAAVARIRRGDPTSPHRELM
jgi:hypothetical protein